MSSTRLPGKVLHSINGKPLIAHVIERCNQVEHCGKVIVCTSTDITDDPLSDYCESIGAPVYRGPLDDVYERYKGCILENDLSAFGRICCDSPGISSQLISFAVSTYQRAKSCALVTNVYNRTFPVGQSIEVVNSLHFLSQQYRRGEGFSKEHVTQNFYRNPNAYAICSIEKFSDDRRTSWAVDVPEDLRIVKKLLNHEYLFNQEDVFVELVGQQHD
jgi:spore coat polysaccharide biosynthesis protein SpsF